MTLGFRAVRFAVLGLLLLVSCRGPDLRPDVANERVEVISVAPRFEGEGKATLAVTLDVLPLGEDGVAESVDWELWLNTRHFASGVQVVNQRTPSQEKTRISFETPMVFRGLPSSSDPLLLTVSVRGGVRTRLRTTEARYPFELIAKQRLENAPVFEDAEED